MVYQHYKSKLKQVFRMSKKVLWNYLSLMSTRGSNWQKIPSIGKWGSSILKGLKLNTYKTRSCMSNECT